MPISHNVDNDLELFVARFSGEVTESQIREAIAGISAALVPNSSYRSLLIFDRRTDLSTVDNDALERLREIARNALHRGRQRRSGAAMVDGSQDAKLIMPLWNAICDGDLEFDMHFDMFPDLESALDWLQIPYEQGLPIAQGATRDGSL